MLSKAYANIGLMLNCKYILDRDSLQTIYFSVIRPALEYADVIWDHIPEYLSKKIRKYTTRSCKDRDGW